MLADFKLTDILPINKQQVGEQNQVLAFVEKRKVFQVALDVDPSLVFGVELAQGNPQFLDFGVDVIEFRLDVAGLQIFSQELLRLLQRALFPQHSTQLRGTGVVQFEVVLKILSLLDIAEKGLH